MSETFQKKSDTIKNFFLSIPLVADRYAAIIDMGRKLPPFPRELQLEKNLVPGCQSKLYLAATLKNGLLHFEAASDALISAGLAALLITVYNGQTPETILKEPPHFLTEIGIQASLSPNRSNGLSSIHLRMKKDALKFLVAIH